ncbi:MAG: TetR/AcrR family transcriptional regulator [Ignavibacteria bacterium]|nr:TetR/AcrR family transcriptional regulator [Ignavibacteria bacterium]
MVRKMDKYDINTEERILKAAKSVFHRKGMYGARMQEIADEAGINKAMLHYYFRNKENLFKAVFRDAVEKIFINVSKFLESEGTIDESIKNFVENYIDIMIENIYLPPFILNEINQNPEKLSEFFKPLLESLPVQLIKKILKETSENKIKPIDPRDFIINIISLCIFPAIAKPIVKELFNMDDEKFIEFLKNRKKSIPEFIINSIKLT